MFFQGFFFSILLLSVSGNPAQVQNQMSLQRSSNPNGNDCSSPELTLITQDLIKILEKDAAATCNCNANVTDCLCLPVSSQHNCSSSCFQEGLEKISHKMKSQYNNQIIRVKKFVSGLKHNKCKPFSCIQPCNETFTVNTMEFIKVLQENFQKVAIFKN